MSSIFLSHNHKDKPFVRELASYLRMYGVEVWVDEAEIRIGDSLMDKVVAGLAENKFVGVVISKDSVGAPWVQKELEIAFQRESQEKSKVLLPILVDDTELPAFLVGKLYANFSSPAMYYAELGKLLEALGSKQKPGQRVYISYSHDSETHKEWVAKLVRKLSLDGKNVIFDYSFMKPGIDFWTSIFKELARTSCIVLIVTPSYKAKAAGIVGGGLKREYEEILRIAGLNPDMKVIPILRNGDLPDTIPKEFSNRLAVDMRDYPRSKKGYQQLLDALK